MTDIFEQTIAEVKATVKDSERCANNIFSAAESIAKLAEKIADEKLKEEISSNLTAIFESCHFQDFTGQRATKIINNIEEISAQTGPMEKQELSEEESLKQGPDVDSISQEDVDNLFNES